MYILPTVLPVSSAEYFCDMSLLIPFCKCFGCIQHREDLQISCSTGTFGWSNTVGRSSSCFLSSSRCCPIFGYLQGFITAIPKLWHCSSADDLHTCHFWLLSVLLHKPSNQKVKHCLTLLHHFRGTRSQCIAPWIYMLGEGQCQGGASSWSTKTLSLIGTFTVKPVADTRGLSWPEYRKGAFSMSDFAGSPSPGLPVSLLKFPAWCSSYLRLPQKALLPSSCTVPLLRITEWLRLKGISGGCLVQPHCSDKVS